MLGCHLESFARILATLHNLPSLQMVSPFYGVGAFQKMCFFDLFQVFFCTPTTCASRRPMYFSGAHHFVGYCLEGNDLELV